LCSDTVCGEPLGGGVAICRVWLRGSDFEVGVRPGEIPALLVTTTPAGAVFLLGAVAMALIALPHIEHQGKP
jgi:hypothetical protein